MAAANADTSEVERAVGQAEQLGVPFTVVRPNGVDVAQLYGTPLALVRPDQHVAWRGASWTGALAHATGLGEAT